MANHTSPIDVIILASDGYYAMVRSVPQLCLLRPGQMYFWSSKYIAWGKLWAERGFCTRRTA